jgi:superfamily I DNA/RNA helicase
MNYFVPNQYQKVIFDWVVNGRGDAVVQAAAGSGKTKTLVESARLLKSERAIFLAFNKHIATELQHRLGNAMTAKTIHSIGLACVRQAIDKPIVDDGKYEYIGKSYAQEIADDLKRNYSVELRRWSRSKNKEKEPEEPPNAGTVLGQLKQLAHYTRVTLTNVKDFDAVQKIVEHFGCLDNGLDLKQLHYPLMSMLTEGRQIAERSGVIDYDDMLWLPNAWNLFPGLSDWVAIDESQDVSPAQLDLILKMRSKGGRMIWVGDSRQAIFGFAGAMSDSLNRIIKATNATVLPLSICYRCPTSHIKLAQEIVPSIEAAPGAIEGIVEYIPYNKVQSIIAQGDLVISRCTAPVVKLCIELISAKIPARVRGRDIGKSLSAIVKEIAKRPDFDFKKFEYALQAYQYEKILKLQQKKNTESQIESLRDRCSGIWVCYQAFNSHNVLDFCAEIEALFSDSHSSVVLSTVHRAKGLEERRVFILRPDQLPLTWKNQLPWQKEQERNLEYVAKTRAKEALFFITDEKPIEPPSCDEDEDEGSEMDGEDGEYDESDFVF